MRNRAFQLAQRFHLEFEVGLQDLLDILADAQAAERLELGQAVEEDDSLGDSKRKLQLVDRFGAHRIGEPGDAPIIEHAVVQPVLVDRGQLFLERLVEKLDDFGVALHTRASLIGEAAVLPRAGRGKL
jgi:hypothetical protein